MNDVVSGGIADIFDIGTSAVDAVMCRSSPAPARTLVHTAMGIEGSESVLVPMPEAVSN